MAAATFFCAPPTAVFASPTVSSILPSAFNLSLPVRSPTACLTLPLAWSIFPSRSFLFHMTCSIRCWRSDLYRTVFGKPPASVCALRNTTSSPPIASTSWDRITVNGLRLDLGDDLDIFEERPIELLTHQGCVSRVGDYLVGKSPSSSSSERRRSRHRFSRHTSEEVLHSRPCGGTSRRRGCRLV